MPTDLVEIKTLNPVPNFQTTARYYTEDGQRIYTLYQLMYDHPYPVYYIDGSIYQEDGFSDQLRNFVPAINTNRLSISYQVRLNNNQ